MKYLLVLAVVLIGIHFWRQGRRQEMRDKTARTPKAIPAPQSMVRCAFCGTHLPAAEAIPGSGGAVYCSEAHRRAGQK